MGWLILAVEELRRLRAVSGHAERFERLITIMYLRTFQSVHQEIMPSY